jgi:hypothetical protein
LGADRVMIIKLKIIKRLQIIWILFFDTLGDDYTFDAFEIIKEGGKVTTIVGPPDEETAKQMGMKDYKLTEKLATLIDKKICCL